MADDQSTLQSGLGEEGYPHAPKSYAMSGRIMLSAIVILFSAVLFILLLHICARCFLLRRRRRHPRLHQDHHRNTPSSSLGLDASVLKSLPIFVFSSSSSTTHDNMLECAVCLSEFQENEKGRIIPKCNHSFHIDCIDMWFHSHSTCPLCRATVESESSPVSEIRIEIAVAEANEGDSSSGLCSSCRNDEETDPPSSSSSSSSSLFRKKEMGIEVGTRRNESFKGVEEVEIAMVSPGMKSPGSRILSLKRILSRERRGGVFCSSSSSVVTEIDLERGEEQKQSQSHQSLSSVS